MSTHSDAPSAALDLMKKITALVDEYRELVNADATTTGVWRYPIADIAMYRDFSSALESAYDEGEYLVRGLPEPGAEPPANLYDLVRAATDAAFIDALEKSEVTIDSDSKIFGYMMESDADQARDLLERMGYIQDAGEDATSAN